MRGGAAGEEVGEVGHGRQAMTCCTTGCQRLAATFPTCSCNSSMVVGAIIVFLSFIGVERQRKCAPTRRHRGQKPIRRPSIVSGLQCRDARHPERRARGPDRRRARGAPRRARRGGGGSDPLAPSGLSRRRSRARLEDAREHIRAHHDAALRRAAPRPAGRAARARVRRAATRRCARAAASRSPTSSRRSAATTRSCGTRCSTPRATRVRRPTTRSRSRARCCATSTWRRPRRAARTSRPSSCCSPTATGCAATCSRTCSPARPRDRGRPRRGARTRASSPTRACVLVAALPLEPPDDDGALPRAANALAAACATAGRHRSPSTATARSCSCARSARRARRRSRAARARLRGAPQRVLWRSPSASARSSDGLSTLGGAYREASLAAGRGRVRRRALAGRSDAVRVPDAARRCDVARRLIDPRSSASSPRTARTAGG